MEPSGLKLIMVQGPRAGETLEFKPGSTIRLGRIVRGNNLTIKDDGISSKHLIIASESESGKWTIQDLDSSNGTILNSTRLPPNTPFQLHHNDTVKLGEYTSISVNMVTLSQGLGEGGSVQPRRNPRRQAVTRVTRSQKTKQVLSCEVVEIESRVARKGRGRAKKETPPEIEAEEDLNPEKIPSAKKNEVEIEKETVKAGETSSGEDIKKGIEDKGGDLERMTLGEWFDYLEVYLPKQIIEATEEMIEGMRTRADRVHQHMIHQKKQKDIL